MARINPNAPRRGSAQSLLQTIDNYYQPARDRVGEAALQRGLSQLGGVFQGIADRQKAEELEDIAKKGQADAMAGEDVAAEFKAIREGSLFGSRSRAYHEAYHTSMGKMKALEYKTDLELEYEKSGLKRNVDPEAFRGWMNDKVSSFLTENKDNVHFTNGAMGTLNAAVQQMSAHHTKNISIEMDRRRAAALAAQTMAVGQEYLKNRNGDALIASLTGISKEAYETGMNGVTVKDTALNTILDLADATDDLDLLNKAEELAMSQGLLLTPKQLVKLQDRRVSIENEINARSEREDKARAEVTEAVKNDLSRAAWIIGRDPRSYDRNPSVVLQETDPELYNRLQATDRPTELLEYFKGQYNKTFETTNYASPAEVTKQKFMVTEAILNGEIANHTQASAFIEKMGYQNKAVIDHIYSEVDKMTDPEYITSMPTYKSDVKVERKWALQWVNPTLMENALLGSKINPNEIAAMSLWNEIEASQREAGVAPNSAAVQAHLDNVNKLFFDRLRKENPEEFDVKLRKKLGLNDEWLPIKNATVTEVHPSLKELADTKRQEIADRKAAIEAQEAAERARQAAELAEIARQEQLEKASAQAEADAGEVDYVVLDEEVATEAQGYLDNLGVEVGPIESISIEEVEAFLKDQPKQSIGDTMEYFNAVFKAARERGVLITYDEWLAEQQ